MAGKIKHIDVGTGLSRAEWEAESTHLIGDVAELNIVRTASKVVAANDALAASKAMADTACSGADDHTDWNTAIGGLL